MAGGTIRKVSIFGITYRCAADADLTEETSLEREGIATSGATMYKETKKVPIRSVEIIAEDDEWETLQEAQNESEAGPLSYENVNGSTYRATGKIMIENRTTQENRVPITLIPEGDWVASLA